MTYDESLHVPAFLWPDGDKWVWKDREKRPVSPVFDCQSDALKFPGPFTIYE